MSVTPFSVIPLHGFPTFPGAWWGCEYPERPVNFDVVYDLRCPACRIKAQADAEINGADAISGPITLAGGDAEGGRDFNLVEALDFARKAGM